ncbi:hypothetical protein ISCGN_009647 [Ixodes scapularis]
MAVLQEHRSKQAAMLEIRPRNLVPDTNCFIDHLPLLQRLVADGHFQVFVPIVVVNELYGLARGTRQGPHQSPDHSQKVALAARAAVSYLEERFDHRESKLKAITSRGSVMDTISFRSEDVTDNKAPAVVTAISEETSSPQQKSTTPPQLDIDPELPAPKRRQLVDLLAEYSDCFATSSKVRQTPMAKHRIITDDDALPVHRSPYESP